MAMSRWRDAKKPRVFGARCRCLQQRTTVATVCLACYLWYAGR